MATLTQEQKIPMIFLLEKIQQKFIDEEDRICAEDPASYDAMFPAADAETIQKIIDVINQPDQAEKIAAQQKTIVELVKVLERFLCWMSEKQWKGGIENGYYEPSGEALMLDRSKVLELLAKIKKLS